MARSTAAGRAAIAILRLSGPRAIPITDACLRAARPLTAAEGHTLTHAHLLAADGEVIDEVVVGLYRAPRSYTGEDVVEISCHGNPVIVAAITDRLVASGARPAEPGEFTRRAFLNGKMDLAQAEAVARLIDSGARAGARSAARELLGGLSTRVAARRGAILSTLAELETHVDFPDEDLAGVDRERLGEALATHVRETRRLAEATSRSRGAGERLSMVIVGAPNAGKSSLFNALVGRDRSIVHEIPGTTRDVVDAEITLGEIALRLTDTAGIAEGAGEVEVEGIRRSREAHAAADRVLLVVDGSREAIDDTDAALLSAGDPERTLVVVSKADLPRGLPPDALAGRNPIAVSVVSGEGLEALEATLRSLAPETEVDVGERVARALEDAAAAAARAGEIFERTSALELVAEELRESANALGRVTGERVGVDVLDVIFSRFCIGK